MEVPLLLFIGLILLLACSAFASASEIAFFSLSPKDVEELKKGSKIKARLKTRMMFYADRMQFEEALNIKNLIEVVDNLDELNRLGNITNSKRI